MTNKNEFKARVKQALVEMTGTGALISHMETKLVQNVLEVITDLEERVFVLASLKHITLYNYSTYALHGYSDIEGEDHNSFLFEIPPGCKKEFPASIGLSVNACVPVPEVWTAPLPIPMRLHCPICRKLHVDEGEFATKPHHTHACQSCGLVWRPAIPPTVGVQFLPGCQDNRVIGVMGEGPCPEGEEDT